MKIKNWMTPNPITVSPDTPLMDAQKIMSDNKIRRLPVVDKKGRVVGIVTMRNIIEASPSDATTLSVYELNYLISKLTIDKVMSKDPFIVSPDDLVMDVIAAGMERGIGAFPVVEDGKLIGIATESEIITAMISIIGIKPGRSMITLENVDLEAHLGAVSKIASIIEKRGVPVSAIFTLPHRHSAGHRVFIRVRTDSPANLIGDLENAGFKVGE